ncbi:MAG: ParB/RepB/Spo0J family partition protein [Nitratireductor sp.]|uniref:ParB/RepB/Spo0J family partition protein n=1 Tax=Alphaproteobacteria TaxID=28211 RepID=UPI003282B953
MADYKLISIKDIIVPERLREVDGDHALAIQASIVEHGLLNPITVRSTPAAKDGKFTLVAGAHRLRAVELLDEREIEALIVAADQDEAILIEVEENLFRHDLSSLDRAIFVQTYRDVWERKYGKVRRGNPKLSNSVNLTELLADEAAKGFAAHTADKLGLSISAIERAQRIAQNIHPDLRAGLRSTPIADNQSTLLRLAKMEPAKQKQAAVALKKTGDLSAALRVVDHQAQPKKPDPQMQILGRLADAWERASDETRAKFLDHVGATIRKPRETMPSVSEIVGGAVRTQGKSRSSTRSAQ